MWITQDGLIGEGPSMNVGFVTQEGVFRSPPFDDILAGCTVTRVMELVNDGAVAHLVGFFSHRTLLIHHWYYCYYCCYFYFHRGVRGRCGRV